MQLSGFKLKLHLAIHFFAVPGMKAGRCFIFSIHEIIGVPPGPLGRIHLTNPGPNIAHVHVNTPIMAPDEAGYIHEDLSIDPFTSTNLTVTTSTILNLGKNKENKGMLCCDFIKTLFLIIF